MSFKEDQQAKLKAIVGNKKGKARDDVLANVVKSSKRTFQSGTPENKKMKKEIKDYKKLDMLPSPPLVVQSTGESNMYINKTASVMEDKQSREIDRNITNAGFGQKSLAVASAFAQGSSVGNAINKFYELNMTEESRNVDKEFKSSINTTFLQDYMAVHGIPNKEKYFELLLGANNKEHLAKISDFIQTDMYMEQTISNSITPLANVSARFVGEMTTHPLSAIATLPTVIPRAMVMAKGAQSTLATLGSSVGISYIGMKATEYGDPSTTSDDFYLGLGVGALADLASTKIMYNKYKAQDNFRDMVEKNIRMSVEATNRTDEAMKYFNPNKHDITTKYKWSVAKENVAKQEASLASDAVQAEKTRLDILNETVSKFVPRKEATASIMARLGLDEEGYSSALSQAQKDTDEILSMIRGESQGNKLVAENNLTKIATLSKAIGDIAPHLEEKIMKEIGKAINKPISQTGKKQAKEVVGKTKDGVSFKISKGKQKYEETSKQMDAQIEKQRKAEKYKFANDVKQSGTKLEGTAEFMNELSKVQKQIVKAEAKLEGLRASGATAESIAKQEEAVAKLIDDEAEAIAKSDTFAKTASTIGSESLARQKEMYQRMASAMDDIVDDMAEELNTRILDDVIDDDAKEVLSNNLSDDLSEALGTEIKVEVKKQSEKGTVSSEADVDTIKGEELAGVIDEMSSLERTANEKYEPYKSARKMTIFTSLKFGELLKSLSGKIGELPLSFSKAGMVKDGSIYVKHGESGYMFPIAHEIGHLVSHKFNSSDFALIKNEIESIKDYFYKKKAGKEAGDSDRFAYETSTSEIIADMYAVYKSNRAKKLNEIAPNLSSIFSRYEDEVLSEIKPASKLDDATLKEFDDAIPKGATEDDLLINSAYKKGESYGWTLDELSKHIDTERVKTATLDSNGNLVIGGGKAVTRNGDIVNESISAERSYVAVDRMVAKSKKQDETISVSGQVDLPIENGYVTVGGNKVLAATAIAALGTTGAMADGGESISAYGFGTFLLAAIAGTAFVKTIKDNPSVVASMLHKGKEAKAVETMAKIESDPIVKERKAWSQKAFDFFKTGYISSYFTVEKYGSDFAKDLVSKLVENPSMFDNVPADVLKNAELKTALGRIHVAEAENFKSFVLESEINTSVLDTVSNLGAETHALENFRLKVSDAIDNPNGTHLKSVTEQAKIYRKELDQAFDAMVANGVYGVDEATRLKNYFPRYIRGSNIVSITSTQEGMDGLINAISLMVKDATGKPQAQADKLADIWVKHATKVYKGSNLSSKEADRFMNAMTEFGIDMKGISKEDIMMAASDSSDVMSRIKSRLPMKMSSFKPFKAMIDGVETTIHAEDIFMRNSNDVVKKYLNESYGQIALKQALGDSYTSESALRAVINEEANQEVRDVLNMYVSALTGKPLYDANTVMNRNIDIAKNLSYGKLLLATVSMTPELIKATASIMMHSDTFSQGVKELKNIFKDIPSNTLLSEELSYSIMGTGTSSAIKEGSFKGIDSFTNINEDVGGLVGRIGNANKSTSLWLSRLIQADDAVKRIASIHNIHRLLDLANNKSTMSQQRMTRYGITPELLATVKNNVKVDSNGNILTIDWNSWKQKDKNMFRAVLHQMNQQRSIEVMIGGIPKASLNNPAGRLLSFLSSFTAQMYSTHFVGMFKSLDQEEMFNQITWMVGGMMTALAKDSISGREKEITDEELVIRTIQSSPAVAPYSLVKLFSDPISLQTGADAIQEVNNLGSIATKD